MMLPSVISALGSAVGITSQKDISEYAKTIQKILNDKIKGKEFFDLVSAWFEGYDQYNQQDRSRTLCNDIEFIIQSAIENFTLISERVDGYFYMLSRIIEYLLTQHQSTDRINNFRKVLFKHLGNEFKSSKGANPNFQLKEKETLQTIHIRQIFTLFQDIDNIPTLLEFFAMCKLAFQLSEVVDESNRLHWKDTIIMIKQWKISLSDIVKAYNLYKNTFEQKPLDVVAFVHFLKVMQPSEFKRWTSFENIRDMLSKLALDYNTFYLEYQNLFTEHVKQRYYSEQFIATFLIMHRHNGDMFGTYLQLYASNSLITDLWKIFLYFSKENDLSEIMEQHLISKLNQKITSGTSDMFKDCFLAIKHCTHQIKKANQARVARILQETSHVFLHKKIHRSGNFYPLFDNEAKDILDVLLCFPWQITPTNPACLFLIEYLIFILYNHNTNNLDKLSSLFQRLNELDEKICSKYRPEKIVQDNWLTGYFQFSLHDLLILYRYEYQNLCNIHQNNRWSLHIWSKLVHFSAASVETNHSNDMLTHLNKWIIEGQHGKYEKNDPLTTILINSVFECIVFKNNKQVLSLPDIQAMIRYILEARNAESQWIDKSKVDEFIEIVQQSIRSVLLLESKPTIYRQLSDSSIVPCILPSMDIKAILNKIDSAKYKFLTTTPHINEVMGLLNPEDIDISEAPFGVESFYRFTKQINVWLDWFEKFIDIFLYIMEWLRTYKMEKADEFYRDMCRTRNDPTMTLFDIKVLIQEILKTFEQFPHLLRLCDLFNCTQWFEITNPGTLGTPEQHRQFIADTKRFRSNDTIKINIKTNDEKYQDIDDRRHVRWALASEQFLHHVTIEYRLNGSSQESYILYSGENIYPNQGIIRGEFKTQRGGTFSMRFTNASEHVQQIIWFQIRSNSLSICHLFHGIFRIEYNRCFNMSTTAIKKSDLRMLMDQVFAFIDRLLDGDITLAEMDELRTVFYDKNINVREEVHTLFANRSMNNHTTSFATDQIEQISKWLKTYEYYSHVNIIIECLQKFKILSIETSDESMNNLQTLKIDSNWSLRDISKTYDDVYRRFEKLASKHLQLIRTMVACPNVIDMMKNSKLYSPDGLRRFQELRDNLTTQFQLQERNNMILNSWIISFTLCEPFIHHVSDLEQFIDNLSRLTIIDDNSCEHIKGT